jgi:hypothetical protein
MSTPNPPLPRPDRGEATVLQEENATVLMFRDSALRRPIDVVAWMNTQAPQQATSADATDNVVPLARFARSQRRGSGRTWFEGPPEGEAA